MSLSKITAKQPRGRPPGTGKDDSAALAATADLLIANTSLRPSTAMRRAVRNIGDSHLRRLQGKWKRDGAHLLAEAAERARARRAAAADDRAIGGRWWGGHGIGATGVSSGLAPGSLASHSHFRRSAGRRHCAQHRRPKPFWSDGVTLDVGHGARGCLLSLRRREGDGRAARAGAADRGGPAAVSEPPAVPRA